MPPIWQRSIVPQALIALAVGVTIYPLGRDTALRTSQSLRRSKYSSHVREAVFTGRHTHPDEFIPLETSLLPHVPP